MKRAYTFNEMLEFLIERCEPDDLVEMLDLTSRDIIQAFSPEIEMGMHPKIEDYLRDHEIMWFDEDEEEEL